MAQNNAYRENGYNDREDYLSCIAEDYGLDLEQVVRPLADLLWVQRPSKEYEEENLYCKPTWIYWSESAVPPHCPFCGYKRQN